MHKSCALFLSFTSVALDMIYKTDGSVCVVQHTPYAESVFSELLSGRN